MSTLRDKLMADLTGGTRVRTGPTLYAPLDNAEIERLVDEFREGGTDIGILEARAIASLAELKARRAGEPFPGIDVAGPVAEREAVIERQRQRNRELSRAISNAIQTLEETNAGG